jgi:quercetin dioxygenase-like cupin family protein
MKHHHLNTMSSGWFVGDFSPAAHICPQCEVAIKHYKKGHIEPKHYHAVATELTAIVVGKVRMMGRLWKDGDIITIEPGEVTDFEALTDCITVVVKTPSISNDKFAA